MRARAVFVTGTDTGVGKTWVATRLLEALRRRGLRVAGAKPVESGGRADAQALLDASGREDLSLDAVNPRYFEAPVAPAAATDEPFDLAGAVAAVRRLAEDADCVVVEGAGGWLAPLDASRDLADLAAAIGCPIVLVAANRLGCLNHALLTLRAVAAAGLPVAAVYLNSLPGPPDPSRESNARLLSARVAPCPVYDGDLEALAERLAGLAWEVPG